MNTLVQPPVTTWVHPLGAPPSPAAAYSPPPGPPDNRGYGFPQQGGSPYPQPANPYPPGGGSPYPQQGGYSPGYQQPPPGQYSPYNQPPPQQQYQGPPPQAPGGKGAFIHRVWRVAWTDSCCAPGLLGGLFSHSSSSPQPGYVQQAAAPKKSGIGMGTALALGRRCLLYIDLRDS